MTGSLMRRSDMQQELVQLGNGAHAMATHMLGSRDDAADAVHDAFAIGLNRPEAFDPGPKSPVCSRWRRGQ